MFGKAGGRVEPLGCTPKKNHPVQIVRKMPLAYDNQRASQKRHDYRPRGKDKSRPGDVASMNSFDVKRSCRPSGQKTIVALQQRYRMSSSLGQPLRIVAGHCVSVKAKACQ